MHSIEKKIIKLTDSRLDKVMELTQDVGMTGENRTIIWLSFY